MVIDDVTKQNYLSLPKQSDLRRALEGEVDAQIAAGRFTYQGVLALNEPITTMVFEYLDGIEIRNSAPAYSARRPIDPFPRGVLVAALTPEGRIRGHVWEKTPKYGTTLRVNTKVLKDFGNIAWLEDSMPDRIGRQVIYQRGWPHRNELAASVVDVAWLRLEVAKGDGAVFGAKELLENIVSRSDFASIAGPEFMALLNGKKGRAS